MNELYAIHFSGDHLAHYGRKGMKWGQNIFQTEYEGKGNSVNTNETPAPKKPSVLQNVNDSAIDTFPETIRKKIREHQEKMNEATNLLDSLTENIIQMDSEEKAKLYASSKIQGLISTIKDELNAAYDLIIPASKKGKAEGKNQWTGEDRLMENIAVDRWIRSIFGDDVVDGNGELPSFEPAVAPETAEVVEEKADPDFLDKVKEQNELKKEKEQLDNALLSISDTVSKLPSEAKKLVFQSDSVQEAIRRYREILNSQYDFELDVMKDEGASRKKIESTENLRDSDLLRFDISLAKVFFDGNYEAFEKESKKLDRKWKRADRIDEFKDDVGDLISSIKDKIDDSKIADEIGDIISDLKDKLKHEDSIESASMQSTNIAPIRGDSYMIHFSGEVEDEYLAHVGVKRRSGRYPWGSGDRPYQGESRAFQDRASAGKISKYEKKRLKEENKAQVERVKAAAAYAKSERKAAERATKVTQAADKQLDKDFDRQQKRVEAEEKLKDKQNKDEVKAINQLSGKMLTPAQQAQLALANMDSMSNQDLKNMLDRIDYQQKLSNIAAADKTRGQKIMSNLGNAVLDVAVKQLIPGAGKVFVEYGQSKLREALDIPEPAKKDDKQNTQSKQKK